MRSRLWIGFMALLASSACASGERQVRTTEGGTIEVTIENDLQPPTMVTVYMVDQVGARRTLGNVGSLATQTLAFDPPTASGNYRLAARTTGGAEITSDPFTVFAGEGIRWRLGGNVITP